MALWARTQQLPSEALSQVRQLYRDDYPIEIRHYLADWIESRCWDELKPNNAEHELLAVRTVANLCNELESLLANLSSPDQFLVRLRLEEVLDNFKKTFANDPVSFVNLVRSNLAAEYRLLQNAELVAKPSVVMDEKLAVSNAGILRELEQVRIRTQAESEAIAELVELQESVALMLHQYNQLVSGLENLMTTQPHMFAENASSVNREIIRNLEEQKASVYSGLSKKVLEVLTQRRKSGENLSHTIGLIACVQSKVLTEELPSWKRSRQVAQNGGPMPNHLDQIQMWCEGLAEVIWLNRNQAKELIHLKSMFSVQNGCNLGNGLQLPADFDLDLLILKVTELLSQLVASSFIVEVQPPQVMKMNTKFTAGVRHIVGGKLNIHMSAPKVRVSIVNEQEAAALKQRTLGPWRDFSGEMLNNSGTLEYHQASRHLSVSFRNLQLKKIKRADKKLSEAVNVTEEKYALLFQTEFTLGDEKLFFPIFALSLPVVVTVHGTQECMAWASISWDNAFCPVNVASSPLPGPGASSPVGQSPSPCIPPSSVSWSQIKELLAMKFLQAVTPFGGDSKSSTCSSSDAPLALTEDHLAFLASKLCREPLVPKDDDWEVTWSSFCKDSLPGRNFSFWDWFFAAKRLIREHLRDVWNSGCVMGFVSRCMAEDMLFSKPHGTFLLRFSDSELGGLTVAWIAEDPSTDKKEVFMLQPFNAKDFVIRSLADRISDLKYLVNLYPDMAKDEAFGKFYSPPEMERSKASNGYVKPNLVTQVPGWTELSTNVSSPDAFFPATPHSMPELGEKKYQVSPTGVMSMETSSATQHMMNRPHSGHAHFHHAHQNGPSDQLQAIMTLGLDTSVALPVGFDPRTEFSYFSSLGAQSGEHVGQIVLLNDPCMITSVDCDMTVPFGDADASMSTGINVDLSFISDYAS